MNELNLKPGELEIVKWAQYLKTTSAFKIIKKRKKKMDKKTKKITRNNSTNNI